MFKFSNGMKDSLWEGNVNRICEQINLSVFRGNPATDAAACIERELFDMKRARGNQKGVDAVAITFKFKNKEYILLGGKIHASPKMLWDLNLIENEVPIEHGRLQYVETTEMIRLLRTI